MKVFKFGGASVSNAERIRGVAAILKQFAGEKLLVVISAMGKTTNALEKVAEDFFSGNMQEALRRFEEIKKAHLVLLNELLTEYTPDHHTVPLHDFLTEVEWLLYDKPVREFDYYYDQIVCAGELLSTGIVSLYLNAAGVQNTWVDVRDVMRTDDTFRDAIIDWDVTAQKTANNILRLFDTADIILTQGFIGATDENESTTLGREGSDYSAAVFANLLDAESQTIWKDVQGVMNADPKKFSGAQWIRELNYREVIEMAYYGAQVIHPKTIKPLQNKSIPLYVKSFLDPQAEGTCIHSRSIGNLPPIIVNKESQALVQLSTRDFSFVGEGPTEAVYRIFDELKFKPNLIQTTAISLLCVVDDRPEKVEAFALRASEHFDITVTKNLRLLTVRHFVKELVDDLTAACSVVLQQQTPETIQLLLTNS